MGLRGLCYLGLADVHPDRRSHFQMFPQPQRQEFLEEGLAVRWEARARYALPWLVPAGVA